MTVVEAAQGAGICGGFGTRLRAWRARFGRCQDAGQVTRGRMAAAIRASYTKVGLRQVKRDHASKWSAVRAAIGDDVLHEIREASTLTMLPAEIHVRVCAAIVAHCGREQARAMWADVMLEAFESRVLGAFVSGALRLYGRKPCSLMRMTPHAWPLVFRDCGRSWMEPSEGNRAAMLFEGLPPVIVQSTGILDSFLANCDAAMAYVECEGTIKPGLADLRAGTFDIRIEWQPRRPSVG